MPYEAIVDSERPNHGVGPGHLYASLLRSARYPRSSLRHFLVEARFWNSNTLTIPLILMESALASIQAFTAAAFTTPDKFSQFCANGGKALGGLGADRPQRGDVIGFWQLDARLGQAP